MAARRVLAYGRPFTLTNFERWDMKPRSLRALALGTTLVVGAALAVVVPGTAAYASTTYTWDKANPEGDHRNWDTKENWSPAGIPGDGDSVVIADGGPDLGVPNGLHLQDLEVTGFGRLSGGSVTVDRLFQWSGGTIHTALTVAFEGMVTAGDGKNRKQLGADLTVKGRLDLVDSGTTDKTHLQVMAPNRIVVTTSGTLSSIGNSKISYTSCCVNPARVVNNGSLTVLGGTLTLEHVQLDQKRDLWINGGAKVHSDGGTVELATGSTYTGGGELHLDGLSVLAPKDDATLSQGAAKLFGTIDVGKDFTLRASNGTQLTGAATVGGHGTLLLDGAQVYGEITTGPDLRLQVIGTDARPTRLTVWKNVPGYRGTLALRGVGSVASGAVVRTSTGALLTVAKGGTLRLLPGALVDATSCCIRRAEVVNERGGTLEVPSGPGTTATLKFVAFRTCRDRQGGGRPDPAAGPCDFRAVRRADRDRRQGRAQRQGAPRLHRRRARRHGHRTRQRHQLGHGVAWRRQGRRPWDPHDRRDVRPGRARHRRSSTSAGRSRARVTTSSSSPGRRRSPAPSRWRR